MEKAKIQDSGEFNIIDKPSFSTEQIVGAELITLRPSEKSSISLRLLASLIDQGILIVPAVLFSLLVGGITFFTLFERPIEISFVRALVVGSFIASFLIVHWLYFTLSESSSKMATLGMAIFGLKVQKKHGQKLNFFEANNRYWMWLFSSIFFGFNAFGLLGEEKAFFHDKLHNTDVVVDH